MMTENEWPQHTNYPAAGPTASKKEAAREGALDTAQQAADSARAVAQTAKSEAVGITADAKSEAANLLSQAKSQLSGQASSQQRKAASGLRSLSDQLHAMSQASDQPGVAANLVRQAAEQSGTAAAWLDRGDPASLLEDVASFARRRPGAFLLLAAGAGVLTGRLSRGLGAGAGQQEGGLSGAVLGGTGDLGDGDGLDGHGRCLLGVARPPVRITLEKRPCRVSPTVAVGEEDVVVFRGGEDLPGALGEVRG